MTKDSSMHGQEKACAVDGFRLTYGEIMLSSVGEFILFLS